MKKKLIYLVIILVFVSALVMGSYFLYSKVSITGLSYSLGKIQESLAETAVIKDIGDLLIAKKKNLTASYTWPKVEAIAANSANQLGSLRGSDPRLDEYNKAATIWTVKIREAAKDIKSWKDVPADPGNFIITLSDSEAEALFNHALAKVFELNLYGSDAIRRKDRETMRYIAAKLLVQDHWLNGLANYKKAGIFSQLIKPVYALGSSPNKVKDEYERVHAAVLALKIFALEYSTADTTEKNKTAAWNKLTEDWAKVIAENDLAPQVLAELMKNAKMQSPEQIFIEEWAKAVAHSDLAPQVLAELMKNAGKQSPPQAQGFKDNCLASGGKIGGVNRNNGWIPTGEDGYYCNFKDQAKACWNFLSYSGDFSAGGDSGCVVQNVLDQATGPNSAAVNAKAGNETPTQTAAAQTQTPAKTNAGGKTPAQTTKTQTQTAKMPAKTTPNLEQVNLPNNNYNQKLYFNGPGYTLTGKVGEEFFHSFCWPDLKNVSDLCGTAGTQVPSGGHPPYHFQVAGGFPQFGLNLNLNGILNGTPTAEGTRNFNVCAVDLDGSSVCAPVTVDIKPGTPWDGSYTFHTNTVCGDRTLTGDYSFSVSNGIIYSFPDSPDKNPKIDANGNVTWSGVSSTGMSYTMNLQFSQAGAGVNLSGDGNWSGTGKLSCTANMSGSRN